MSEETNKPLPSADDLRMAILQKEMAEIEKRQAAQAKQDAELRAFADDFLHERVTPEEAEEIRARVRAAVNNNKFEALVYTFPSDLCSDSGRAINNRLDHWPETLQGKAKEVYDAYISRVKDKGYRLKATIITYPGGMPGDVGFFLNWEPPQV
jgi:hypothetical protein